MCKRKQNPWRYFLWWLYRRETGSWKNETSKITPTSFQVCAEWWFPDDSHGLLHNFIQFQQIIKYTDHFVFFFRFKNQTPKSLELQNKLIMKMHDLYFHFLSFFVCAFLHQVAESFVSHWLQTQVGGRWHVSSAPRGWIWEAGPGAEQVYRLAVQK